jgi:enoyl-CoA hydratase/carnithine racemase
MTSFQTLRTDVSHRVATIWLNRPERRNAFSSVMTRELYGPLTPHRPRRIPPAASSRS